MIRTLSQTTPDRSARDLGFHATDTVDYAVCLEGEVWAVLDEEETLMRAGDVLIQLEGKPVTSPGELISLLDPDKVGKAVTAKVSRAGAVRDVSITVGSRG